MATSHKNSAFLDLSKFVILIWDILDKSFFFRKKTSLLDKELDLTNPREVIWSKFSGPIPDINPTEVGLDEARALLMQYVRSAFLISEKSK